jgi:hypothetical protein
MDIQNLLFFDLEIFESEDQESVAFYPDICDIALDWDILNLQPAI